jgi:hypothetical protein
MPTWRLAFNSSESGFLALQFFPFWYYYLEQHFFIKKTQKYYSVTFIIYYISYMINIGNIFRIPQIIVLYKVAILPLFSFYYYSHHLFLTLRLKRMIYVIIFNQLKSKP